MVTAVDESLGWDRGDREEIRDRGKVEDRCGRGWAFLRVWKVGNV